MLTSRVRISYSVSPITLELQKVLLYLRNSASTSNMPTHLASSKSVTSASHHSERDALNVTLITSISITFAVRVSKTARYQSVLSHTHQMASPLQAQSHHVSVSPDKT